MKKAYGWISGISTLSFSIPINAYACEPIAVFTVLAGPAFFVPWLSVLLAVVAVKCFSFALLERRIPFAWGFFDMFVANIVSSILGILLALPFLGAILFPLVFPLAASALAPTRRFSALLCMGKMSSLFVGFLFVVGMILSGFLFFAAHKSLDTNAHEIYWVLKIAYIAVAFLISIGITTLYEEWIISRIHTPQVGKPHYFKSVFSANLMAFLLSGGIAAAYMLPKRLASPSFLVEVLRRLVGVDV